MEHEPFFLPIRKFPSAVSLEATSSLELLENWLSEAVAGVCRAGGNRKGKNNLKVHIFGVKCESITSV